MVENEINYYPERELRCGGFFARIIREYINPGYWSSMRIPGHLEYEAHQYGLRFGNPR